MIDAVGDPTNLVVVGHSYGAFTAPLVADRLSADALVLVAGMIPSPGEAPADWWDNTDHARAVRAQAKLDGGKTGNADPFICYYHDVPRVLAEEALRRERDESSTAGRLPWPLDAWPNVRTKFILCKDDRLFPADFCRRLVPERLGIMPDEIPGGHCVALSRPGELADLLVAYTIRSVRYPTNWNASDMQIRAHAIREKGGRASPWSRELIERLGGVFVDTADPPYPTRHHATFDFILSTLNVPFDLDSSVRMLKPEGQLCLVASPIRKGFDILSSLLA